MQYLKSTEKHRSAFLYCEQKPVSKPQRSSRLPERQVPQHPTDYRGRSHSLWLCNCWNQKRCFAWEGREETVFECTEKSTTGTVTEHRKINLAEAFAALLVPQRWERPLLIDGAPLTRYLSQHVPTANFFQEVVRITASNETRQHTDHKRWFWIDFCRLII